MSRPSIALLPVLVLLTACPSNPVDADVLDEPDPPTLTSVTITPDPATTVDDLTCSAQTDFQGEGIVDLDIVWTVDGEERATGADLAAGTAARGDVVDCTVTPSAGDLVGPPQTASVTIGNALPTASTPTITPEPATTIDDLTCASSGEDPDDDPVTLAYAWTIDGADAGDAPTLAAASFAKGQVVACDVTPNDGFDDGATVSTSLTIANSPPGAPELALDPDPPIAGEEALVCRIASDAPDLDGDAPTYSFAWTRDGADFTSPITTVLDGDTVPSSAIEADQTWTCTVTASDGESNGPSVSLTTTAIAWSGPITLTTCGQTGATGPSQSQCDTDYAATGVEVEVTEGFQYWTVPFTGAWRIEVAGARGGDHNKGPGGFGARMVGDFDLEEGDVLKILVGQAGQDGTTYDNGGGGGTFVALDDDTPLIVAGGGGGAGNCGAIDTTVVHGSRAEGDGSGGQAGNNGTWCGCGGDGSAGGGFTGDGAGDGGKAFVNGGVGATSRRPGQCVTVGAGGFGGGGNGGNGGPGGGGYEGGNGGGAAAGDTGHGGRSYNDGRNQENTSAENDDAGYVIVDQAP